MRALSTTAPERGDRHVGSALLLTTRFLAASHAAIFTWVAAKVIMPPAPDQDVPALAPDQKVSVTGADQEVGPD
jgi:hypothetical protein